MSYSIVASDRLDNHIRVAKALIEINEAIFGETDANTRQYLSELLNSRKAVEQIAREEVLSNLPAVFSPLTTTQYRRPRKTAH